LIAVGRKIGWSVVRLFSLRKILKENSESVGIDLENVRSIWALIFFYGNDGFLCEKL